jgi:hypothetical protein
MKKYVILLTGIIFLFCLQGCSKDAIQAPLSNSEDLEENVPEENPVEKNDNEVLSPAETVEPIEEETRIARA